MNPPVLTMTMTMPETMTMSKTIKTSSNLSKTYEYDSFWSLYSFSQVPIDDWDDFSFFECKEFQKNPIAPLPLQLASVASGCRFLEDAQLANMNRMTKELNRKFQAIYDEMMQKKELERELEFERKEAKFKEAQAVKAEENKAQDKAQNKAQVFRFFENRKSNQGKKNVHKDATFETSEVIAKRHSEARKKKNAEKKVLDTARSEAFEQPSLLSNQAWINSIGEKLGFKNPSTSIRAIRDKLNISDNISHQETKKVVDQEYDIEPETSSLTEEQVAVLIQEEKEEKEAIMNLTSTFIDTFELAEKQRKQEEKELRTMILQEEETKLYNKAMEEEISRAHREFLLSLDSGFVVVGKKGKTIKSKEEIKEEIKPKLVLGATKPKINKICRTLKAGSNQACENVSCPFLHNLDELNIEPCRHRRCSRVKQISPCKYINIEIGCKFIHTGESRTAFFIREGFLPETKEEKKEEVKEEKKVESKPTPPVVECNAWKQTNPKVYIHPEQKAVPCIHREPKIQEEKKETQETREHTHSNTKTKLCESVYTGNPCRHKNNCRFAHSLDEINILECPFGNRCGFVQNRRGVFFNSEGKFCKFIHPEETRENYFSRNGIVVKKAEPKAESCKLKTKICNSVLQGVTCRRRHCDFAHNEQELNIRECTFPNCKLVQHNRHGVLVNVDESNRCSFFHKGETKKSFFWRLTY